MEAIDQAQGRPLRVPPRLATAARNGPRRRPGALGLLHRKAAASSHCSPQSAAVFVATGPGPFSNSWNFPARAWNRTSWCGAANIPAQAKSESEAPDSVSVCEIHSGFTQVGPAPGRGAMFSVLFCWVGSKFPGARGLNSVSIGLVRRRPPL